MSTLYVKNEAQRIIFVHEMSGQISDGQWENASPHNHWQKWCQAKVVVSDTIGRDFWALKDNYNFANSELLSIVGDRILMKVKAALLGFSEEAIDLMPESLSDYEWNCSRTKDEYFRFKVEKMNLFGINAATVKAVEDFTGYTMKDLRKDCAGLRVACKTRI